MKKQNLEAVFTVSKCLKLVLWQCGEPYEIRLAYDVYQVYLCHIVHLLHSTQSTAEADFKVKVSHKMKVCPQGGTI